MIARSHIRLARRRCHFEIANNTDVSKWSLLLNHFQCGNFMGGLLSESLVRTIRILFYQCFQSGFPQLCERSVFLQSKRDRANQSVTDRCRICSGFESDSQRRTVVCRSVRDDRAFNRHCGGLHVQQQVCNECSPYKHCSRELELDF